MFLNYLFSACMLLQFAEALKIYYKWIKTLRRIIKVKDKTFSCWPAELFSNV